MKIEIENVLKNLIFEYRRTAENFNKEDKIESGFIKFESPLQAELIHFERKKHNIDFQILVFTSFPDMNDLDIIVHSPLKFREQKNNLHKLKEITRSDKWVKRKFSNLIKINKEQPDELQYSIIFENIITDAKNFFFTLLTNYLFSNQYQLPYIISKSGGYKDIFSWIIFGNIQNLNVQKYVSYELYQYELKKKHEKKIAKIIEDSRSPNNIKEQNLHEVRGFGTYIYPPKWIGKFPELEIEDKLTNLTLGSFVKNPLIVEYKDRILFIEKDGYIAIGEPHEEKAIELLNEIMGTLNFSNQGAYSVRRSEVGAVVIDTNLNMISLKGTPNLTKNQILEKERERIYRSHPKILRNQMSKDQMEKIIKLAEKINKNNEIKNCLIMYSETFSFFYEKEYTLSFLMSWFIFEKILNLKCEELINQPNLDKITKDFLDNNFLTPDVMIKALFSAMIIDQNEFYFYLELKDQRNCIIHENKKSNYEESAKFKQLCFEKIKEMIEKELKSAK